MRLVFETVKNLEQNCIWNYVRIFFGLVLDIFFLWWNGFSIPMPGLECLARLVDLLELWINCVVSLSFFPCYLPLRVVIGLDGW